MTLNVTYLVRIVWMNPYGLTESIVILNIFFACDVFVGKGATSY